MILTKEQLDTLLDQIEAGELDLAEFDRLMLLQVISEMLVRTRGNQTKAARLLGMDRSTLKCRINGTSKRIRL